MGNVESRKTVLGYLKFIAGEIESVHDMQAVKRFIDRRTRAIDLLQMREFHAVVNSKYRKGELVDFFCNLQAFERKHLLKEVPSIIVSIPYDFKLFQVPRTKHIGYRSTNFGGSTVEYAVFSIVDLLDSLVLNQTPIS